MAILARHRAVSRRCAKPVRNMLARQYRALARRGREEVNDGQGGESNGLALLHLGLDVALSAAGVALLYTGAGAIASHMPPFDAQGVLSSVAGWTHSSAQQSVIGGSTLRVVGYKNESSHVYTGAQWDAVLNSAVRHFQTCQIIHVDFDPGNVFHILSVSPELFEHAGINQTDIARVFGPLLNDYESITRHLCRQFESDAVSIAVHNKDGTVVVYSLTLLVIAFIVVIVFGAAWTVSYVKSHLLTESKIVDLLAEEMTKAQVAILQSYQAQGLDLKLVKETLKAQTLEFGRGLLAKKLEEQAQLLTEVVTGNTEMLMKIAGGSSIKTDVRIRDGIKDETVRLNPEIGELSNEKWDRVTQFTVANSEMKVISCDQNEMALSAEICLPNSVAANLATIHQVRDPGHFVGKVYIKYNIGPYALSKDGSWVGTLKDKCDAMPGGIHLCDDRILNTECTPDKPLGCTLDITPAGEGFLRVENFNDQHMIATRLKPLPKLPAADYRAMNSLAQEVKAAKIQVDETTGDFKVMEEEIEKKRQEASGWPGSITELSEWCKSAYEALATAEWWWKVWESTKTLLPILAVFLLIYIAWRIYRCCCCCGGKK